MNLFELKSKIPYRTFDYQKLKSVIDDQKHERRFIGSLLQKRYLIRVKKGLYIWGEGIDSTPYSREHLSNLIYGPSYVSLEYALSFHRLIPERVQVVTAVTIKKTKEFSTPVGNFSYEHLNLEAYYRGFVLESFHNKQNFMMATPEKALLDTLALRYQAQDLNQPILEILEHDLRIDLDEFHKLQKSYILTLGSHYIARSVQVFCRWIKKEFRNE